MKKDKTFDAVAFMREQRARISEKLARMSKEEILEYLQNLRAQHSIKPHSS